MAELSIHIVSNNSFEGIDGYSLKIDEKIIGKGFYEARVFENYGEAQVAAGILNIVYTPQLDYSEYDFILRAALRLIYTARN